MKGLTCHLVLILLLVSASYAQTSDHSFIPPTFQEGAFEENGLTVRYLLLEPDSITSQSRILLLPPKEGITDAFKEFAQGVSRLGIRVYIPDFSQTFTQITFATRRSEPLPTPIAEIPQARIAAVIEGMLSRMAYYAGQEIPVIMMGIEWGAYQVFEMATQSPIPTATLVFGGEGPKLPSRAARIQGPVYGFYASDNEQVTQNVLEIKRYMNASGKAFYPIIYPKSHGTFILEPEEALTEGSLIAQKRAWERIRDIIRKYP